MAELVMAVREDPDGTVESEPIAIETDAVTVTLVLDDGTRLSLDRGQLAAAVAANEARQAA